jgi:hypothetical protein
MIGHGFQQFVYGLEYDQFAHIGFFTKQFTHSAAHDVVGI